MLIDSTEKLHIVRDEITDASVGFAPTMGNLHAGHLTLVKTSLEENDVTFISIFVNPTQFGPNEDFGKYPRTLEEDFQKIESLARDYPRKKLWIYAPKCVKEIYPDDWDTQIEVPELSNRLCGKSRPGHFPGVCTVVYRLFSLVRPHNSYFGQKDYQQCLIIKKMVRDLRLPVNVHMAPIVRDYDGLALSSRNQYLNEQQRTQALELSQSIEHISSLVEKTGYQNSQTTIREYITQKLRDQRWEYLETLDAETLGPPLENTKRIVTLGAFKLGQTRLIDNMVVQC